MGQAIPKVIANMTINLRWKISITFTAPGAGHKICLLPVLHDPGFRHNVLQDAINANIYGLSHTSII